MVNISDKDFEHMITQSIDALPKQYTDHMQNVAITWENRPSIKQKEALKLRCNQTLFGLYEGIPLTKRGMNYSMVAPDRITIFKDPLCEHCDSNSELQREVYHTLWHEVAHHFGLNHEEIHQRDGR